MPDWICTWPKIKDHDRPLIWRAVDCLPSARSGRWLYPVRYADGAQEPFPHPATEVHFHAPGSTSSQGYGGRKMDFTLDDGSVEHTQGPWHGSAESLLQDTGVDMQDKYLTFCVIGTGHERNPERVTGVLHQDVDYVVSEFDRPQKLAQQYADRLRKSVYLWAATAGGGRMCWVRPTELEAAADELFRTRGHKMAHCAVATRLAAEGFEVQARLHGTSDWSDQKRVTLASDSMLFVPVGYTLNCFDVVAMPPTQEV